MSSAGIIAHRLHPSSGPPSGESLVWWAAGDGIVQKVKNDGTSPKQYAITGADLRQVITVDHTRNRVFVPTNGTLYIFEGATATGDIPVPTEIVIPNIGTLSSWGWIRGISLDPTTGQLFLAGGTSDTVTIIDSDNSVTTVAVDNAFSVHALGSGKFAITSNGINTQVWGPSNSYATHLVQDTFADATSMATVYDSNSNSIFSYLETDEGGLRIIDVDSGSAAMLGIDNHYGSVMARDPVTGYIIINQTGDNGKVWVYDPTDGSLIVAIDYSTEEPGATPSGAPTDMKVINGKLCLLQRWDAAGTDYMVFYVFDLLTGTLNNWDYFPSTDTNLTYYLAADPTSGLLAGCDVTDTDVDAIDTNSPFDTSSRDLAAVGCNTLAYSYLADP